MQWVGNCSCDFRFFFDQGQIADNKSYLIKKKKKKQTDTTIGKE